MSNFISCAPDKPVSLPSSDKVSPPSKSLYCCSRSSASYSAFSCARIVWSSKPCDTVCSARRANSLTGFSSAKAQSLISG